MLRSMTGFGARSLEGDGVRVQAEVRSVNHRFLQLKTRLPSELSFLEPELDRLVKEHVARGAVTVFVGAELPAESAAEALNPGAARAWYERLRALSGEMGLDTDVSLGELVQLPGVVASEAGRERLRGLAPTVLASVGGALEELVRMRGVEGEALERDLRDQAAAVADALSQVDARMPKVVQAAHEGLRRRADELISGKTPVSETDLARELALLADKLDVSEELSRLGSHLQQLEQILGEGGQVGRKLDFLVQEMFREVNTIGSKCGDAQVSHQIVEIKTRVERLREQVQNLE